jgi:hypothetical protein
MPRGVLTLTASAAPIKIGDFHRRDNGHLWAVACDPMPRTIPQDEPLNENAMNLTTTTAEIRASRPTIDRSVTTELKTATFALG